MSNRYGLTDERYAAAIAAFHAAVARAPGQVAFANICRCTQGNISLLLSRGSLLPVRHVLRVEAATGISRVDLRPDIYGTSIADLEPEVASRRTAVACDRRTVSQRSARA